MKLETAARMGAVCGLEQPEEWMNNVRYHVMNLFPYEKINDEWEELIREYGLYKNGELEIDFEQIKREEEEALNTFFDIEKDRENATRS